MTIKAAQQKSEIVSYLTNHISAQNSDIAALLGVKSTRVKQLLQELVADGIVVAEGEKRSRRYRLK